MAVKPATNHITLVSYPTSGAAGTTWLSSRGAYEHRAHPMWALSRPHPLQGGGARCGMFFLQLYQLYVESS